MTVLFFIYSRLSNIKWASKNSWKCFGSKKFVYLSRAFEIVKYQRHPMIFRTILVILGLFRMKNILSIGFWDKKPKDAFDILRFWKLDHASIWQVFIVKKGEAKIFCEISEIKVQKYAGEVAWIVNKLSASASYLTSGNKWKTVLSFNPACQSFNPAKPFIWLVWLIIWSKNNVIYKVSTRV